MRRALLAVCVALCLSVAPASVAGAATTTTSPRATATPTTLSATAPTPALVTAPTIAPVVATTVLSNSSAKKSARTTVNVLIGVLLILAALVIGISVWYWKVTRPIPAQLEPLATMSTRSWRKAPAARQEASLERVRPKRPLDPMLSPVGSRGRDTEAQVVAESQPDGGAPS